MKRKIGDYKINLQLSEEENYRLYKKFIRPGWFTENKNRAKGMETYEHYGHTTGIVWDFLGMVMLFSLIFNVIHFVWDIDWSWLRSWWAIIITVSLAYAFLGEYIPYCRTTSRAKSYLHDYFNSFEILISQCIENTKLRIEQEQQIDFDLNDALKRYEEKIVETQSKKLKEEDHEATTDILKTLKKNVEISTKRVEHFIEMQKFFERKKADFDAEIALIENQKKINNSSALTVNEKHVRELRKLNFGHTFSDQGLLFEAEIADEELLLKDLNEQNNFLNSIKINEYRDSDDLV